ncbi:Transposase [compost metagenome]
MHNQYADILLDLPEVRVIQVMEMDAQTIHMEVTPTDYTQACPLCLSAHAVIRKGSNRVRKIRHRSMCSKRLYLLAPAIRLFCNTCQAGFVWKYAFAGPGKRYSFAFEKQAIHTAAAATVQQSAAIHELPGTTLQNQYQRWLSIESGRLQKRAWYDATGTTDLVLGVDDFAIRKGHTYNTGIHNLRGETLLDILPGRKLEDLRTYMRQHPTFRLLRPKAVVMDLAPYYHAWVKECFPEALRIADRFHVHGYVVEAVQSLRKSIQGTLASRAKGYSIPRKHPCRMKNRRS